ncbi:MAG: glycosyltransferase family 4 protein [Actinomycetes bacterium]
MSSQASTALRVFHVIDGLGTGGAERSLAELLTHLDGDGIASTIWSLERRKNGVEESVAATADVRFLDDQPLVSRVRRLRRAIRSERPDLVHTTLFAATTVGRFSAAGGPPVLTSLVNTPYDPIRRSDRRFSRGKLQAVQAFDRTTSRLTDHFHAISHAVADAAVRDLGKSPDRITVVPRGRSADRLGTPSESRRLAARRSLGVDPSSPLVVNVGRQEFQKGQRHLLEAARLLREGHRDLVVLICGREGAITGELKALHASLGLGDKVRFLGHRDDVPDVLAAADVFAFPSLFEGLGGSLIEAMALGVPIVASDIPAIRETVVDTGCATLVPPASADALAMALADLIADRSRRAAYADHGIHRFEEHYALPGIAARMATLYRTVASGQDRGRDKGGER